jgi:hypothetical protein
MITASPAQSVILYHKPPPKKALMKLQAHPTDSPHLHIKPLLKKPKYYCFQKYCPS